LASRRVHANGFRVSEIVLKSRAELFAAQIRNLSPFDNLCYARFESRSAQALEIHMGICGFGELFFVKGCEAERFCTQNMSVIGFGSIYVDGLVVFIHKLYYIRFYNANQQSQEPTCII
jgi:hypothetical protein